MLSKDEAHRWTRAGILAAFAIVLSYVETFIPLPLPLPGAKWGLANIAILMALVLIDGRSALAITMIKTLVTGLLFGSPLMIPYSAAGALLALGGMAALLRVPGLHLVLVSIAGAMLHVAGQLAVAGLMLGTPLVWYSLPFLLAVACATGAITGKASALLIRAVEAREPGAPLAAMAQTAADAEPLETPRRASGAPTRIRAPKDARPLLAALVVYVLLAFCLQGPLGLGAMAAIALAVAIAVPLTPRDVRTALAPLASILAITAIAQMLYAQQGTVLATLGPVRITQEALAATGTMVVRLSCIMLASVAFMRVTTTDSLMQALKDLTAPLERLGLRTAGFVLSCHLALEFIPILTSSFKQLSHEAARQNPQFGKGSPLARLRDYQTLIAPLATAAFAYADAASEALAGHDVERIAA